MKLQVLALGYCDYEKALAVQLECLSKRQRGEIDDTLILVEHPPVITLGNRATLSNIIVSEDLLREQGIQLYQTNRGGDVTYHGRGQIVGYPIVDLKASQIGIRNFVKGLEEIFVDLLRDQYKIAAETHCEHRGVWVGTNKIAALGLAVKRGVTMHGFAFNVNTNLAHFNYIIPCGIADRGVTSIEALTGKTADLQEINKMIVDYFVSIFHYESWALVSSA